MSGAYPTTHQQPLCSSSSVVYCVAGLLLSYLTIACLLKLIIVMNVTRESRIKTNPLSASLFVFRDLHGSLKNILRN